MRPHALRSRSHRSAAPLAAGVLALALAAATARAQSADSTPVHADAPGMLVAVRTAAPPRIDGRDDDAAWRDAPPMREFRMFTPIEGAEPTLRTEARITYDDHALYVLVRAFDPHPDSIVSRLTRRDTEDPTADRLLLFLDSYHDRRTGFEFFVTAGGVKTDAIMFDDSEDDTSWDGVWDVATSIDSLGWIAEFAIPFRQLRFTDREHPVFGLTIGRWVGRSGERMSIPQYRRSLAGLASQLGTLTGLHDLPRPSAFELTPYALTRAENGRPSPGMPGSVRASPDAGAALEWRPRPSLALDLTINPDFGQVEADPAALDLTGTEVFQAERRPFFVEGAGLLTLPLAIDSTAQLFYSRRIGRAPTLGSERGGLHPPATTTILGAAKLTSRLTPTTTLATLGAVTDEELGAERPDGRGRYLLEPRARFAVARLQRDFRDGRSGIGVMTTALSRDAGDSLLTATLVRAARAAAVTTQHQTADGFYRVNGWVAASEIEGDTAAITRVQLSTVHAFQRPDDGVEFDPSRTRLAGSAAEVVAGKVGGGVSRFDAAYRWVSDGFDVNELGYLPRAGLHTAALSVGLDSHAPGHALGVPYRSASATLRFDGEWTRTGLPLARGLTLATKTVMPSQWQLQLALTGELPGAYCTVTCTRGGPALVDPPAQRITAELDGDARRSVAPRVSVEALRDDGGRSHREHAQVDATWRIRSNFDVSLAGYAEEGREAAHYFGRFGDPASDTARYAVARLEQSTRALTTRLDYTFTTALTLQWYAQAYVSRGAYADVRELADPRARDWEARFTPSTNPAAANPGGIDFEQLRCNAVLRWEYRSGSTLFVVWSQGRDVDDDAAGTTPLWPGRAFADLFGRRPANTVAVKLTYWIGG